MTVNAQPVEHDGTGDLIGVGVRAVALRFARVMQRPVPTIVIHGGASHRLLVHPNGATSDVEPLGRDEDLRFSTAPPSARGSSQAVAGRPAGRSNGGTAWAVVGTVIAVALVVGLLTWVLTLVRDDDGDQAKNANSTPTASQTPTTSPSPTASATTTTPTTKPKPPVSPLRIRAKAAAGRTTLTLKVSVTRPTPVTVRLVPAKTGKPVWRTITKVGRMPVTVVFRKLPPGTARWTVIARGGVKTAGTTKVLPRR
ncbi:hypothetical protein [Nocardioides speluncae]|uniref:hypothetical protein n=1 Tax=Nocardioides speluncae TaxID=2670337 RepID=UPI0012B16F29|nr:hypothetical protein [Nocardioides speluncae]